MYIYINIYLCFSHACVRNHGKHALVRTAAVPALQADDIQLAAELGVQSVVVILKVTELTDMQRMFVYTNGEEGQWHEVLKGKLQSGVLKCIYTIAQVESLRVYIWLYIKCRSNRCTVLSSMCVAVLVCSLRFPRQLASIYSFLHTCCYVFSYLCI